MLYSSSKNPKGPLEVLYPARYLITMMGFFAVYCGLIYNDFFSFPVNLFGSCYNFDGRDISHKDNGNCSYAFGVDPVWDSSTQIISFTNSLKMKISVILGVIQMSMGSFL